MKGKAIGKSVLIKLPDPPEGMEWYRKPGTNQYVLILKSEFERRMRKVN